MLTIVGQTLCVTRPEGPQPVRLIKKFIVVDYFTTVLTLRVSGNTVELQQYGRTIASFVLESEMDESSVLDNKYKFIP